MSRQELLCALMSKLKAAYNVDFITYARYYDDCVEWYSTNPSDLSIYLQSDSIFPRSVESTCDMVDWKSYCSDEFLTYCEDTFHYRPSSAVTVLLSHESGFAEHVSLGTCDMNNDLRLLMYSNPKAKQALLTGVRNTINFNPCKNTPVVTDYSGNVLRKKNSSGISYPLDKSSKRTYVYGAVRDTYLTQSELNCLQMLLQLQTSKQIARNLNISVKTVESHIANFKSRLGACNRHDLYNIAKNNQLI